MTALCMVGHSGYAVEKMNKSEQVLENVTDEIMKNGRETSRDEVKKELRKAAKSFAEEKMMNQSVYLNGEETLNQSVLIDLMEKRLAEKLAQDVMSDPEQLLEAYTKIHPTWNHCARNIDLGALSEGVSEDEDETSKQAAQDLKKAAQDRENAHKDEWADQVVQRAMKKIVLSKFDKTEAQLLNALRGAVKQVAKEYVFNQPMVGLKEHSSLVDKVYHEINNDPQRLIDAYKKLNPTWKPNQESE